MISVNDGLGGAGGGSANVGGSLAEEMHKFFSKDGALSKSHGFAYREQQQQMAVAVAEALEGESVLSVEAGTGVGKSLAYLVPAVLHALNRNKKAVISTHTINLQEQLIGKDLPIVKKLLDRDFDAVLLKGRGNYICPARLRRAMEKPRDLFTSSETDELKAIWDWAEGTTDGSLSDMDFRPNPKVWSQVCSEAHVCTRKSCGRRGDCFYQEVKKRAEKAAVIVVNHTLFFTLYGQELEKDELGDDTNNGYLFGNDFAILDEAHTIEDVAAKQLGIRLSHAGLKFDVGRLYNPKTKRGLLKTMRKGEAMQSAEELLERAEDFFDEVAESVEFGQYAREFRIRKADFVENSLAQPLRQFWTSVEEAADDLEPESALRSELMDGARRMREMYGSLQMFLDQEDEESVYWVEKTGRDGENLVLQSAPINVADRLRDTMFGAGQSCVLTSATLGAGDEQLDYFRKRVGAERSRALKIGSPFDYAKQMEVYVMQSMPDPGTEKYEEQLVHWIGRVLKYTEGKAFVLFTSYRVMRNVAAEMEDYFDEMGWRLLVQGDGTPRHQMVDIFREDVHSVLFGTDSFWAGVDVPGESLSNVIVTRLPFSVPDHPLIACKIEAIEEAGGNPFMEYSVPEAVIKLRQGVGRLIRKETDSGLVVILDNRVVTKRYGKLFLNALPPAPINVIK